jgi:hypothetical protein
LALLQEEAGACHESIHGTSTPFYKNISALKNAHPLPAPPMKMEKQAVPPTLQMTPATSSDVVSKLSALKQYRRALSLCYKCGAKWSKDHKCSLEVLHAVLDLWECLSPASDTDDNLTKPHTPQEHLCLAISKSAVSGAPAPRIIQFIGTIQGVPLTILLDSGSTSSFISTSIVHQLSSQTILSSPASVCVAGGGVLTSPRILHNAI